MNTEEVIVSAPGKQFIFGEHAVANGKACIVTSVSQRMRVRISKLYGEKIILKSPDVGVRSYTILIKDLKKSHPKETMFVLAAVKTFFKKYNIKSGLLIKTKSEFSSKLGFGSSSAVTVCTIKGLANLFRIKMSNRELFNLAYKTVLDIQKVGSGADVAAAIYGGTLYYSSYGKVIEKINIKNFNLVVGYTGIKADTKKLVKMVNEKKRMFPDLIDAIFDLSEKKIVIAKRALEKGDVKSIGWLMNFSHGLLNAIGVSCKELEKLTFAARDAGAYGAKLSGAGGGDCMIALVNERTKKEVENAICRSGGKIIYVTTNVEGVKVE